MLKQDFLTERDLLPILLTLSVGLLLYWLWSRRNLYRFAMNFPGTLGWPLIGSLFVFKSLKYFIRGIEQCIERFKCHTFCVWLGVYPTIMTADPEFIEQILSSTELLNKATAMYLGVSKAFGGGIICSEVSEWQRNRKLITPSFHHKVLLTFIPVFNKAKELTISLMDPMLDDNEHDLTDMLHRISLGIAVETTMGKYMAPKEKLTDDFTDIFLELLEHVLNHITFTMISLEKLFLLNVGYHRTKKCAWDYVLELVTKKLDKLKEQPACTNNNSDDSLVSIKKPPTIFIDQAIQIYQQQKFSFKDLIVESNNILVASFETSANGIYSALVMLAMHPDIQERLFDEIVNVFPEKDFEMEYEHMQQLPYLDMVINETLRLCPSLPVIGRQVVRDTQLANGIMLPKGLQVLISIFHVHRRKDIWGEKANEFDPDNFLPGNIARRHAYSYLPFSKGMRNCIGWRYALMSMKVILAAILRNYKLTTSAKYEDLEYMDYVTLKYAKAPLLKLQRREK